jgi:UDP-glucose 4-epimerase
MKVLVTGGTGYIGSHTVVELQQQGHDVYIIDNLSNSEKWILDQINEITGIKPHFEQIDLCDLNKLNQYFQQNPVFDGVIHFAALKAVGESMQFPLKYYHNNLTSLLNLLQCMKQYKVNNLVFSSSCTVYGQPDILPVSETSPIKSAFSPYGYTKQVCEALLADTSDSSYLKSISLRYFNPIGAHESAKIGELPVGMPNNLVPFITQTAIGIRDVLNVFGNNYDTPDGTCIRDYIHVTDLAKAHIIALERLVHSKTDNHYEVFNLGTGKGHSVIEVITSFEKISGLKLHYKFADPRPGDIAKVWANTEKANTFLGWKAEKDLDEMTLSAWNWELALKEFRKKKN